MIGFIAAAVILLSGCSFFPGGVVTLYTNRQEIASYAETFNAVQNGHRLEIHYRENPSRAASSEDESPDLVITENIAGRSSLGRFRSLNKLFDRKRIPREAFYSSLLSMGQKDKQQVLVPISFDLPVLMFDTRVPGEEAAAFLLNLDTVQELGEKFNTTSSDGSFTVMGFGPRWNPEFLLQAVSLLGADFTEGSDSVLAWNDRALRGAVDYLRAWSKDRNGGPAAEAAYQEKYLYDPPYRQISLGRAKFAYSTVTEFFLLPENRRLSLDFRWLAHKNKILALDRILFAGIPVRGKNPRGAEAFLRWLLDGETQKKLLESSRAKMTHVFGIASGLSSLKAVNENEFPRFYPHLSGHIPPEDSLSFPPPAPDAWGTLKHQVVIPWLQERTGETGGDSGLEAVLRGWQQRQAF
jgi:ABC-type glycerol-3-phosphate transport system substrate-binding protein